MKKVIFIIITIGEKNSTKIYTQEILGRPLLSYNLETIRNFSPEKIFLFVDKQNEQLKEYFNNEISCLIIEKWKEIFTHLLNDASISDGIEEKNFVLLRAEFSLISVETLRLLLREHLKKKNILTFLTSSIQNGKVGTLVLNGKILPYFEKVEFKKTNFDSFVGHLLSFLNRKGEKIGKFSPRNEEELISIRKKENLPKILDILRLRKICEIQKNDVKIIDPLTTWIDKDVKIGKGTVVYPFNIIEGKTEIGKRCVIYPFSYIRNCEISDDVKILKSSFLEEARVMKGASVGPYSRIRPNTIIEAKARIGNFVEVKNTVVGKRSKALHLTYLGDAKIGQDVNVGAGTITCNFDGKNKNITIIESGAFIGSGTELVAPVKVGKKAYIGAGSTITKDVPPYALGIARERQTNIEKWVKRKKK